MAISFTLVASHNQSCYNDYQIKTSTKITLQQILLMKKNEVAELQTSLNAKLVEVDEIKSVIDILTTEVEELHTTCDIVLAKDCCQVN